MVANKELSLSSTASSPQRRTQDCCRYICETGLPHPPLILHPFIPHPKPSLNFNRTLQPEATPNAGPLIPNPHPLHHDCCRCRGVSPQNLNMRRTQDCCRYICEAGVEKPQVNGQPHTLDPTPYSLHPAPHTAPYTLHPSPHALHPTPHALHPTPYTLHPTPYTPHPTPYTQHSLPYSLQPTLHTPHPTPYTLHLTP